MEQLENEGAYQQGRGRIRFQVGAMTMDFYRAFEDKHRGSRDMIISRLKVYLPFVEPLKGIYDACHAVDLGCGRGEWLELLRDIGIDAQGVDLDEGMLAACRERGLSVQTGDAIALIKSLPSGSQVIVSGFHVAEHLPFSEVVTLVREGLRVLRPAGLLILETPNPENLVVGATNFYLDPTHVRPLHPELLLFLAEYFGFSRSLILRLQESPELIATRPSLLSVLSGVSLDFSIVAQKSAPPEMLGFFAKAFGKEYGVTLGTLATYYDQQSEGRIRQVDLGLREVQADLRSGVEALGTRIEELRVEVGELGKRGDAYLLQLQEVYSSNSWKVTAPLRALHIKENLGKTIRGVLRLLRHVPGSAALLSSMQVRFPGLWSRVSKVVGASAPGQPAPAGTSEAPLEDEQHFLDLFQRELSRRQTKPRHPNR